MGGRGLVSCEGCIRMEKNNFGWYVRNAVEPLIEGVKAAETIEYNDRVNNNDDNDNDNSNNDGKTIMITTSLFNLGHKGKYDKI